MTSAPQPSPEPLVRARRDGSVFAITLDRPRAINALTSEMFALLDAALRAAHGGLVAAAAPSGGGFRLAPPRAILLDGAGERGFCGGGDIKEISTGDTTAILAAEYRVDHAIATSRIPVVAVMDGVTMGGGIGLGGHAALRIVTERSRLAMPEVRIGIVPDVGGHLLLARAPGRLGELLALTAREMGPGDAIALGFADRFLPAERLGELRRALVAGDDPERTAAELAEPAPEAPILAAAAWWAPIAEAALGGPRPVTEDPRGAALRLLAALEASPEPAARAASDAIRGMCPMSVVVTLAQIDRTRREGLALPEVLADDLRVLGRLGARADFREGVRAQVIDKDRSPRWIPDRIEELDPAEVARILDPAPLPGEAALRFG
ncbi:enoyl-CoA hydratase/isomerase family protein [Leucobacter allii]|uniref:3-hydroxyisobutyryl-CoA hydrolase n=1 Tax=Leucobacter allii TaxID=2932247 RepID=A0ABY4FGQ6_9MICO|nr:enoyl-CoA hydratase/isomerase family protein [Leucobacter allii]UOQ55854.1 enoyl-CoA hydratase/isomerase family protein [Leucobacter allii]UOR00366.1 enoyl-CoA hydratase/isomerase family protein [Leucobacter allii]